MNGNVARVRLLRRMMLIARTNRASAASSSYAAKKKNYAAKNALYCSVCEGSERRPLNITTEFYGVTPDCDCPAVNCEHTRVFCLRHYRSYITATLDQMWNDSSESPQSRAARIRKQLQRK
jgi:hypothetical protein